MHSCERCDRPLLSGDCPFCGAKPSRRWLQVVGAMVTPFVLGACYGPPPCDPHDDDGDGFDDCLEDCDPNDPEVNPDAEEICDDEIDNNCDGVSASSDGVEVCGNEDDDDCDGEIDEAPGTPGIEANCYDELDDDCDGLADADDPDCADQGTVVIGYSFDGATRCADAGLDTLTLAIDNGTGTREIDYPCDDNELYYSTAAGAVTLTVTGAASDGVRSWSSVPIEATLVAEQSVSSSAILLCTGCD